MTIPTPENGPDQEAKRFYESLETNGQIVDVSEDKDTSKLPPRITHVRYPDGTIKRIRFASAYGKK